MKIVEKTALLVLIFSVIIITLGAISLFYLHIISLPLENEIPKSITELSDSSQLLSYAYLIEYYDEVLTQSARNYAFTQNVMWKERYQESEPKLDQAIIDALKQGGEKTDKIFSQINDANIRLVELEYISLNLVDDNKSDEAIIILESEEYWNLKQKYHEGLVEFSQLTNTQYFNAVETSLITLESVTLMTSNQVQSAFQAIFVLIFVFVTASILLSYFSLKSTIFPISKLRTEVNKIATKNMDVDLEPSGDDEIQDLTRDIKIMHDKLIEDEKKLLKSEKLSAIGQLSARLAHDLRNPLHVIKNTNVLLKIKNPEFNESSLNHLKMQDRAISRMAHQLEEVMDFVREKPITLVDTNLFDLLDNMIHNMNIPEHVKITYPENDLTINCDPNQMQTVFSNLILNGIQAINEEGQIDITASNSNDALTIVFTDSGPGIPEENIDKIFEPLFTTKQKGTGLGLASCKTIIESHGGSIRVDNDPTSFKIVLPKPTKNVQIRS